MCCPRGSRCPRSRRRARPCSAHSSSQLLSDLLERGQRPLDVLLLDRRRHLDANPRRPLRDDRVAEPGDEDALLEQPLAEADRERGLADDDRDDRGLAVERREAELAQPLAERPVSVVQAFATSSGSRRSTRTASSAEQATVGGRAFEKSCGRERWARMSQTSSLAATNPPAAPPSALPSVEVITSTSPSRPKCSATPRPVSPTRRCRASRRRRASASCSRASSTSRAASPGRPPSRRRRR